MRLEWSLDFSTGNDEIDRQNQWFFKIFNELAGAAETDNRNPRVEQLVNEIEEYANLQFAYEEKLLKKLPGKNYHEHAEDHRKFLSIIRQLNDEIYKDGDISSLYLIILFLSEWIFSHVKYSDRFDLAP